VSEARVGEERFAARRTAPRVSREERLQTLTARWQQFAAEYVAARGRNDQELMTNLRGLLLLIKREILRLGGTLPEFPADENHLADL
jgi:hypothetical protein